VNRGTTVAVAPVRKSNVGVIPTFKTNRLSRRTGARRRRGRWPSTRRAGREPDVDPLTMPVDRVHERGLKAHDPGFSDVDGDPFFLVRAARVFDLDRMRPRRDLERRSVCTARRSSLFVPGGAPRGPLSARRSPADSPPEASSLRDLASQRTGRCSRPRAASGPTPGRPRRHCPARWGCPTALCFSLFT
jgi:hypothetical protein